GPGQGAGEEVRRQRDAGAAGHAARGLTAPVGAYCGCAPHRQAPSSKTICQLPSALRRQVERNSAIGLPSGSKTGPLVWASSPLGSTTTMSGRQEKGASGLSKKRFQWAV